MTSHNIVPSPDQGDNPFDDLGMKEFSALRLQEEELGKERRQSQATIDMLPDDVLLEIFNFYREDPSSIIDTSSLLLGDILDVWRWQKLTHVCRRWRDIVLGSPRHLKLHILCTTKTPTRMMLDIWPPFPIIVFDLSLIREDEEGLENIIAAVECRDRISQIITGDLDGPAVERLAAVMQEPLPHLTSFHLISLDESVSVLPDAFLGGSAPLLQMFVLFGISFPTFPKFVLSATRIVYLYLQDIPHSGYISPEDMATCLAALPKLELFNLGFRSHLSRPLQLGLSSLTRVLPSLSTLYFTGASEYLEDFIARTHIPLLKYLDLQFFMVLIFDTPRLHRLIIQMEGLEPLRLAWVTFSWNTIAIQLGLPARIRLGIFYKERDRPLLSLAQVCGRHLPLSSVEQLSLRELSWGTSLDWKDDVDSSQWLELFRPFIAVRNLYVSKQFVPFVTTALQGLTEERAMEVLPVLENLFLEGFEPSGPVQDAIKSYLSARQLSDHPILVRSESSPY